VGVSKSEPLNLDFMVGNALIARVEAGNGGIPLWKGKVVFCSDRLVELFAGGMVVVSEIEDPF